MSNSRKPRPMTVSRKSSQEYLASAIVFLTRAQRLSTCSSRGFERQPKVEEEAKFSSSYTAQLRTLKGNDQNQSAGKLLLPMIKL